MLLYARIAGDKEAFRISLNIMAQNTHIAAIDQAIAALKVARKTLKTSTKQTAASTATKTATKKSAAAPAKSKGGMSAEGRARVAEAQRKRWAAVKRAAKKAARQAVK